MFQCFSSHSRVHAASSIGRKEALAEVTRLVEAPVNFCLDLWPWATVKRGTSCVLIWPMNVLQYTACLRRDTCVQGEALERLHVGKQSSGRKHYLIVQLNFKWGNPVFIQENAAFIKLALFSASSTGATDTRSCKTFICVVIGVADA